jgi:hypothetical protein
LPSAPEAPKEPRPAALALTAKFLVLGGGPLGALARALELQHREALRAGEKAHRVELHRRSLALELAGLELDAHGARATAGERIRAQRQELRQPIVARQPPLPDPGLGLLVVPDQLGVELVEPARVVVLAQTPKPA